MKFSHIATLVITGAAAAAIVTAPAASAASVGVDTAPTGATITQRDGHVHIHATPPPVSEPRSYGEFASPALILGD
ncbi:hypothetical protein [Mycolicibacterium lacusdiani]|uniref:hypothetical protein n=1 Tax=Mycolicibacterium lacusdiani TaxID=2895283 RepID=UPI001F1F1CE3|nr:hypothetical protein [Mycolicibacterium lacusdiani]